MQLDRAAAALKQAPSLRYTPGNAGDVERWACELRAVVRRQLNVDSLDPLTAALTNGVVRGATRAEEYLFHAPDRRPFRGIVLRPVRGVAPVVLVCPGLNANIDAVTGLKPPDHPGRDVAARLGDAGIGSLTFDYGLLRGIDSRRVAGRDETTLLALMLGLTGRSPLALLVEDALRAVAWLRQQEWVARGQLGLFGHSLGAHVALHTALAMPQRVPTVLASFLTTYSSLFVRDTMGGGAHALPNILRFADLPDLVAALVPADLQVQIGEIDTSLPVDDALAASDTARSAYHDLSAAARLDVHVAAMGHATDLDRMCRFFADCFAQETDQPLSDRIPAAKIHFSLAARREITDRIDNALSSGQLTLGRYGARFEQLMCGIASSPHAVAVNSGTAALEIALRTTGVAGRTVLVPANTFFATALAALHAGADVRFVDIETVGLGMDPDKLRSTIARTRDVAAVVVVHIGGIIAPSLIEVLAICRERGIPVVEDAAHALGSRLGGAVAGAIGDVAAFSFYPTKIATSGEGGVLTTRVPGRATLARLLRDQGKESFLANIHQHEGYNWRMSEVHASIGIAHLERLEAYIGERQRQAILYDHLLENCPGVHRFPVPPPAESNYYKYIALLDRQIDRDAVKASLSKQGVALSGEVYQIPCTAQPYFNGRFAVADFPRAHDFCRHHICLPVYPTLTETEQKIVVQSLANAIQEQHAGSGNVITEAV